MPGITTPEHAKRVAADTERHVAMLAATTPVPPPDVVLTPKREHFARLVAAGFTQSDAYRQAFGTTTERNATVWVESTALAADPSVARRIDQLRAIATAHSTEAFAVSRARVLAEMYRIATADPRKLLDAKGKPLPLNELPDELAAAIEQVDIVTGPDGQPQYRYRLARKAPVIDQLAKVLGMYEADNRQRSQALADVIAQAAQQAGAPSPRIGPAQAPSAPPAGPAAPAGPNTPASPAEPA